MKYSDTSLANLDTCEPELKELAILALEYSPYDIGITEGIRTKEQQRIYVAEGKSTTMKSKHLANRNGLSEAFDFVVYAPSVTWEDKYYRKVVQAFVRAAIELNIQVEFGALWEDFIDGPHVQLKDCK